MDIKLLVPNIDAKTMLSFSTLHKLYYFINDLLFQDHVNPVSTVLRSSDEMDELSQNDFVIMTATQTLSSVLLLLMLLAVVVVVVVAAAAAAAAYCSGSSSSISSSSSSSRNSSSISSRLIESVFSENTVCDLDL